MENKSKRIKETDITSMELVRFIDYNLTDFSDFREQYADSGMSEDEISEHILMLNKQSNAMVVRVINNLTNYSVHGKTN
jgi:hypothetical protein